MPPTDREKKNWLLTLPGMLTALATLITALTGLYLAIKTNQTREEAEHFASEVMNPSPSSSAVRLRLGMLWS